MLPENMAAPETMPMAPKARARSWAGKLTWIIDNPCGNNSAAVMPWKTREAISTAGVVARPQQAEAKVNPATPTINILLRPRMSPSRPPVMRSTA